MSIGYNSVYFATNTPVFQSVLGLRTFKNYQDGLLVFTAGNQSITDQDGGAYVFDATSTSVDDGITVIKPTAIDNNSPGRWLIIYSHIKAYSDIVVGNIVSNGSLNLDSSNITSDGKGNFKAAGNITSQNSFICTGYAELIAGNNSANKLELTSDGVLNIYSGGNKTLIVNSNGSFSSDNGKVITDGSGLLTTSNINTGTINASGNVISQNSFICTGYAELIAGNNSANKIELTSDGALNIYSGGNKTLIVNSNGSFSSDNGKVITDGSGLLTTSNINTGTINASGNVISQNSFICTGYAELIAGNNSANKIELTSDGALNIYSSANTIFSVASTGAKMDSGKITTDGSGNISATAVIPSHGATGTCTTADGKTVTVTSGIITKIA